MPNLIGMPYADRLPALARARATWWQKMGWPMTPEEKAWVLRHDECVAAPAAPEKVVILPKPAEGPTNLMEEKVR